MPIDPQRLFSVEEARRFARRRLPGVVFDYVDGAAGDEITVRANRQAFHELALRQATPGTDGRPSIATTVLGTPVELPVLLGPCGLVSLVHPGGALASARAAAAQGTISVLSTVAGTPLEPVAAGAPGPKWFQVYAPGGVDEATALAERARDAGYLGLMITVDTAVLGKRERDLAHGITMPPQLSPRLAAHLLGQVLSRPAWTIDTVRDLLARRSHGAGPGAGGTGTDVDAFEAGLELPAMAASPFTWADVATLRDRWSGHLIVKGLMTGDEARRAVDAGADAVVVSNHGGRQLDGAPATMRMLPEVVDAVGSRTEVLVDGGVRRGTDVVRALALGARAVLIGRPYLYGLAAAGQGGVERILAVLGAELRDTLTLLGRSDVSQLGPDVLVGRSGSMQP
jgi:L-lactate dehydrogenase (cytochrome)